MAIAVGFDCVRYSLSGEPRSFNGVVTFYLLWVVLFLWYRWYKLRNEEQVGSFSEERYKANPSAYLRGPLKIQVAWFGAAIVIILIWDFCRTVLPVLRH
jgi:hypothetical protein